jgi:PPM family protein phosphatase
MESIHFSGNTDPGRRRKENQDAYIVQQLWSADKALLAVIDGVGGYTGGEKAAAIAKESIEQYMQLPSGDTLTMLREAVLFANNRIVEERKKEQMTSEMCCVLTAVVADAAAQCIYYAHVGDTRLFCYRDGKLQKITRDHSFVGIREDAGEISEADAMSHPQRNQILREVGSALHRLDDEDFMDYGLEALLPGDQLLLCSDGLTDMVTSKQMIRLLSAVEPLESKVKSLIEFANMNGGHDNITVVLLESDVTTVSSPGTNEIPVPVTVAKTISLKTATKTKTHPGSTPLLIVFLLLVVLAGTGWYFAVPRKAPGQTNLPDAPEPSKDSSTRNIGHVANTTVRINYSAIEGPVKPAITDTLRLSATQDYAVIMHYTDSTGRCLVLLPKKGNHTHFPAMTINGPPGKPGDTIVVRNIHLVGFETGIEIHIPVILQTENLVFENTTTPFRYLNKADNKHVSRLFINTLKQ